jgi:hypothetical protein
VQYHRAQDTFIADLEDGTSVRVAKGEVLPESHELVKRDLAGSGTLFRPLDDGSKAEKPPAKSEPAKAEPKEPVKPAAAKPAAPRAPAKPAGGKS